MSTLIRLRPLLVVVALLGGLALGAILARPVLGHAQQKEPATRTGPHYTVVFTEGTNLCVTDNQANKVYFYTVDSGKEAGSDLKLRATVDLKDIGKDVIKPNLLKK